MRQAAPPAAPQSSLIDLASPEKQGVAGAGAAARVHSSGAAVTPSHAAPAPADGWAAFGEAAEGVPGARPSTCRPRASLGSVRHAATLQAQIAGSVFEPRTVCSDELDACASTSPMRSCAHVRQGARTGRQLLPRTASRPPRPTRQRTGPAGRSLTLRPPLHPPAQPARGRLRRVAAAAAWQAGRRSGRRSRPPTAPQSRARAPRRTSRARSCPACAARICVTGAARHSCIHPLTRVSRPAQDLFCELPPQPQAPQAFGSGARTAPAGAYGGGFPPRPPGEHTRGSYSAGWAPSGPGAAAGAHAGNSAQPGGFYGGARQPAGDSLVASSGVHGSPEGSVRSAASEAAAPDPFSALMPGLRGAARAGSLGGDAAPAGPFAPAAGMPGGSAANGAQAGAAFPGTQQAPSVGSSASVPASPATPVPPGFAPTAPWGGAGAAPHGLAARQGSGAAHAAPLAQPGTGGGFAWGGAATPAAGGGFGAFFPASQAPAFEAQPYGMVHGGGLTGPRAGDGAAAAPAQTAAPGPALRKSSGNPFA